MDQQIRSRDMDRSMKIASSDSADKNPSTNTSPNRKIRVRSMEIPSDKQLSTSTSPNQKTGAPVEVIVIDDTSSDSNPLPSPPSSAGPSRVRKRKMVVSSNDTAKKPNKHPDSVDNISSSLTIEDVRRLFVYANISFADYEYLVPSKDQRANRPPQGYVCVYAKQVMAGFRFPMQDLLVRICNLMKISPSQLVPNAHSMIVGFILCATFYGIPLTEDSFFSLFNPISAQVKGLFHFSPISGKNFLHQKPSSFGPWKKKFFFLRRRGNPWNCITDWGESFLKPKVDVSLANIAIGMHFQIPKLTCKDILVSGGIEPGVPSPEFTFRYLMNNAAVVLEPSVHATAELEAPSAAPLAANANLPMLTSTSEAHCQKSENEAQELFSKLAYSNSRIEELQQELKQSEKRRVESEHKIEYLYIRDNMLRRTEKQIHDSELTYLKSRIEELQQELELSEARAADAENRSYLANEALQNSFNSDKSRDYAKSRIEKL